MSSTSSDLTPLSGRLRVMTVARIAAVVALVLILAPILDPANENTQVLTWASGIYVGFNFLVLLALRARQSVARGLLNLSLLGDAAWATSVMFVSGRTGSAFIFLMYLQLIAATVLFTWRTGIKLAIGHTLGLIALFYDQVIGFVGDASTDAQTFGFFSIVLRDDVNVSGIVRIQFLLSVVTVWVVAAATAFFSNVNERELRRSNRELAVLRELSTQLERSLDLADVCQSIAQGTVRELGYSRSIVWMAQGGRELVPAAAEGFETDQLAELADLRLIPGPGPIGKAIDTRQPVLVAREQARPSALADAFAIDAPVVVVPLTSEGRVLGLLTVEVSLPVGRAPRVRGRDLRILSTLATEASLALDNARLHAELRDLSITDALTGIYNHRYFQQRLQEELDRSARAATVSQGPRPVSLILMDVDLFKKVNDRFGHQAGDELLRMLARLTQRVLRSSDVVCRYGGEEFGIILPETTAVQAIQVAERLREAIERSNFTADDGRYLGQVTSSFGVATYAAGVPSRSEVVRYADEALYAAKGIGRNAVFHAGDIEGPIGEEAAIAAAHVRRYGTAPVEHASL